MREGVVLSLFPGIDLLGRAFEAEGFSVLRGPDAIYGGDIREFHPPAGCAWGIIGGPPCQDFSAKRRTAPTGYGRQMLAELVRVIEAVQPEWYCVENVARVPDVRVEGYSWQRFDVDQGWFVRVSRLRHWQFGSRSGTLLDPIRGRKLAHCEPAALACDGRTFAEVCRLQGLPADFDLPGMTVEGKIRAVGNGVPIYMGRAVARDIRLAYHLDLRGPFEFRYVDPSAADRRRCACGCKRTLTGRMLYYSAACRKRAQRTRDRSSAGSVTPLRTIS